MSTLSPLNHLDIWPDLDSLTKAVEHGEAYVKQQRERLAHDVMGYDEHRTVAWGTPWVHDADALATRVKDIAIAEESLRVVRYMLRSFERDGLDGVAYGITHMALNDPDNNRPTEVDQVKAKTRREYLRDMSVSLRIRRESIAKAEAEQAALAEQARQSSLTQVEDPPSDFVGLVMDATGFERHLAESMATEIWNTGVRPRLSGSIT